MFFYKWDYVGKAFTEVFNKYGYKFAACYSINDGEENVLILISNDFAIRFFDKAKYGDFDLEICQIDENTSALNVNTHRGWRNIYDLTKSDEDSEMSLDELKQLAKSSESITTEELIDQLRDYFDKNHKEIIRNLVAIEL